MPLHLYYRPSFERGLKRLGYEQKKIVGLILESIAVYYSSGCDLLEAQKIAPRFFYKQLRKPYYEAGIEGTIRVIIRREDENCIVVLVGNHDQIRQFLAGV
jgi:mRNA-degrading endonuclease RelE of RelBE toxin-antitoxin system